ALLHEVLEGISISPLFCEGAGPACFFPDTPSSPAWTEDIRRTQTSGNVCEATPHNEAEAEADKTHPNNFCLTDYVNRHHYKASKWLLSNHNSQMLRDKTKLHFDRLYFFISRDSLTELCSGVLETCQSYSEKVIYTSLFLLQIRVLVIFQSYKLFYGKIRLQKQRHVEN
uniref:Uncharacterized protein n=1 Tax=Scleropages formosus TaxID=113540 RepID=A0A8C9TCI8_SCLFO